MKTAILSAALLLLLPAMAVAQYPHHGYIGLFADDSHTLWCVEGMQYTQIELWVWCLPGDNGQKGVEFGVRYSSNVIQSTTTLNEGLWMGVAPFIECEGDTCSVSGSYYDCQYDWHWVYRHTLFLTDASQGYCEIVPHPDTGEYRFWSCLEGYPEEPCVKYTNLYINYPSGSPECEGTEVETKTWGAIKQLYD